MGAYYLCFSPGWKKPFACHSKESTFQAHILKMKKKTRNPRTRLVFYSWLQRFFDNTIVELNISLNTVQQALAVFEHKYRISDFEIISPFVPMIADGSENVCIRKLYEFQVKKFGFFKTSLNVLIFFQTCTFLLCHSGCLNDFCLFRLHFFTFWQLFFYFYFVLYIRLCFDFTKRI